MAQIEIHDLSFTYPNHARENLKHINLSIEKSQFVTLCGKSGSGKTTLLKHIKTVLTPYGTRRGEVLFEGRQLHTIDQREQTAKIGYVMQNPDNQIVTDKVWHELAFGLESLACKQEEMRIRVAEMAEYFGISSWFRENVSNLSGGQKQLLNLASVMVMQPSVLILDEPISQLDPIAANEFLRTIQRINCDLGTTIIISAHRLEDILPISDRIVVMEEGEIILADSPDFIGERLQKEKHDMLLAMPSSLQIYYGVGEKGACPLTVRHAQSWLSHFVLEKKIKKSNITEQNSSKFNETTIIQLKDVWFQYKEHEVLKGVNMDIPYGKLSVVMGSNGSGKTTMLKIICGILKPCRGNVWVDGKKINKYKGKILFDEIIAMLPQEPKCLFVKSTVREELMEIAKMNEDNINWKNIIEVTELSVLLDKHPYDLSGGEQQRVALAKILMKNTKILLLDEPTKGMDNFYKRKFARILCNLKGNGITIFMVSHDIEFCARYADYVSMFFDGTILTTTTPKQFFSQNNFYTTEANRISRHIFSDAITYEDVIAMCTREDGEEIKNEERK